LPAKFGKLCNFFQEYAILFIILASPDELMGVRLWVDVVQRGFMHKR